MHQFIFVSLLTYRRRLCVKLLYLSNQSLFVHGKQKTKVPQIPFSFLFLFSTVLRVFFSHLLPLIKIPKCQFMEGVCASMLYLCRYVQLYVCFSYPPEVFSVGLFWYVVFGVDVSLQRAEPSPLWDVLFAEHTCHLETICNIVRFLFHNFLFCFVFLILPLT